MENLQPKAVTALVGIVVPKISPAPSKTAVREAFSASKKEQPVVLLTYVLAYIYIRMYDGLSESVAELLPHILLTVFTLGEYLHRDAVCPCTSDFLKLSFHKFMTCS